MIPAIWRLSNNNILHWHLVGVRDMGLYTIAWKELHRAELIYKRKWKEENKRRKKKYDLAVKRYFVKLKKEGQKYYGKGANDRQTNGKTKRVKV